MGRNAETWFRRWAKVRKLPLRLKSPYQRIYPGSWGLLICTSDSPHSRPESLSRTKVCAVLGKCSVWGKREFWLPHTDRPPDGERTVRGRLGRRAIVSERRRSLCSACNATGFPRPEFPGLWQAEVGFLQRRPQVYPPNAIAVRGKRRRLRSQDRLRCRCGEIPARGGISALCAEREWQSA